MIPKFLSVQTLCMISLFAGTMLVATASNADVCESVSREEANAIAKAVASQVMLSPERVAYVYDPVSRKTYSVVSAGTIAQTAGYYGDPSPRFRFAFIGADSKSQIVLEDVGKAYLAVDSNQKGVSLQFLSGCGGNFGQNIVIDFPFPSSAE